MKLTQRTIGIANSPIGAHAHLVDQVPKERPLLDLSQGAPGFPPAPEVSARMAKVAGDADGSRYAPLRGLPQLREAFANEIRGAYGGDVGFDDVCITAGCNQAYAMVVSALAEVGDEVILTLPYYFNHDMWLGLDGLVARYLRPATGVTPSVAEAEALITTRTRALVLVTPGNPTGHVLESELLADFATLADERDIVLVIDETYRSFVPGDQAPHELFTTATWRDHVVSLHSFSKDLAIPGQRVGAVVGHPDLLTEVAKLIDCVTICAPRLGQEAAHAGLTEATAWREEKVAEIAEKEARFADVMSGRPGGFELVSHGAYYGWVRHDHVELPTEVVVERLLLEQGVLTIPGTAFLPEDEHMIRFSFANVDLERIDELGQRLVGLSESLRCEG